MKKHRESPIDDHTGEDRSLLIVDDARPFRERLSKAMARRGFDVRIADSIEQGIWAIKKAPPAFATIDMRLADGSGGNISGALTNSAIEMSRKPRGARTCAAERFSAFWPNRPRVKSIWPVISAR